ncbi:MAG: glycosyltransferase family 1 protein [Lachnospiraceae bacterium]|nr:glycosyltransferase family 1 protein [Lachnospiraceae bacterium]
MAENKQIRVLHVLGTTNLGGAESRVMELYRSMDRERVQFDFLIHTDRKGDYSDEILKLGGSIYSVPRFTGKNYRAYKNALSEFFGKHNGYAAVHGHMTSTASIYLPIAKRAGIPLTIAHARSAGVDRGIRGAATKILRLPLKNRADVLFTCSAEAGKAVYGKKAVRQGKVWTVPNAIDAERFKFNGSVRDKVREELGLTDKFVIGHVGRFGFMKNHEYLLDVFGELCRLRDDAALALIGRGELENKIRQKAKDLGLEQKVYFLGVRPNVEEYYQAFDYFVFPSTFEGLPGSAAEAQAAGLHCLISDRVTREAALTDLAVYKSIDVPAAEWAGEIQRNAHAALTRRDTHREIIAGGFDVKMQAEQMEAFYRTGKNPPGHQTYSERQNI